ncbi:MAG: hypothetical protein JO001_15950 [Alphaproteobacteria bacterium]|nr:hypothetical protein [Alphaproteobacteria bacterium]
MTRTELLGLFQSAVARLDPDAPEILQFMSAHAGEGTSTIAKELASAVATAAGRRVLLVVMAPRGEIIGHSLDDVLNGEIPLEKATYQEPGAAHASTFIAVDRANPALFQTHGIGKLFGDLLGDFDVVIIDALPVLSDFAGLALVRNVGGVILVIEAERTRSPVITEARRLIEANGGHILGVVFNKRRYHIPRSIYRWI